MEASLIRAEFEHAWAAYRRYAWGKDELLPLSLSGRNWHNQSLLLTPIDVLDTLALLGLEEELNDTLQLIVDSLDFDVDIHVNVFETNIRVLGGLLSGFQFTADPRLLDLADDLGGRLISAFDTRTGLPHRFVNLKTGVTSGAISNPAEAGTLVLEFGLLADLTGNDSFRQRAQAAQVALFERRSELDLVGSQIDVESGMWVDRTSHIAGLIDSYYEYLLKGWKLFGDSELEAMWRIHLAAIQEHVVTDVGGRIWCRRVDMDTGREVAPHYGALDAFFAGALVLAGELETAAALQESGMAMWTRYGLEPEVFDFAQMEVADDQGAYFLRPELAESAFYLFGATGEQRYRRMGETIFRGLVDHCRTEHAYAAVADVRTMEHLDGMESFFLAETLKYLYLLFVDDGTRYLDHYVFTTEAHPLRPSREAEFQEPT